MAFIPLQQVPGGESDAIRRAMIAQMMQQQAPQNWADAIAGLGGNIGSVLAHRGAVGREEEQQQAMRDLLMGTPAQMGATLPGAEGGLQGLQPPTPGLAGDLDPRLVEAMLMMDPSGKTLMQAVMPKPAEPFTLSPGEVRYGRDGQPVASVPAAPDVPNAVQEMQYFGMDPNNPADVERYYTMRRGPGTTVNVDTGSRTGPVPPGMVLRELPEGGYVMEEIPGGPAEQERLAREHAEAGATERAHTKADVVGVAGEQALELLEEHGNWAAGAGSWLSGMPGSVALELRTHLDTIRANVSFQELVKIKEQGGSLGALSDTELALLGSLLGSLDQGLPPAMLANNIRQIDQLFGKVFQEPGTGAGTGSVTAPTASEEGLTATNPQTGERVIYRNGQWEPL